MEQKTNYVLITGATSGIGYELAKLFAADGYNLVLVSRSEDDLQRVAAQLKTSGNEIVVISKDLFNPGNASQVYKEVQTMNIQVDVLVNDAGQGIYGEFIDTELERELAIIQLNISSLVVLTKHFLKDMVARNSGKILNLASIASKVPGPYQSVYHATKAFVLSFTEAIRSENIDKGVTITALLPGVTDTDFFNKADMNDSKAVQDKNKMADPKDVAKDGYEALMAGKDKVISGLMNKLQTSLGNIIPDTMLAEQVKKQQEPQDKQAD